MCSNVHSAHPAHLRPYMHICMCTSICIHINKFSPFSYTHILYISSPAPPLILYLLPVHAFFFCCCCFCRVRQQETIKIVLQQNYNSLQLIHSTIPLPVRSAGVEPLGTQHSNGSKETRCVRSAYRDNVENWIQWLLLSWTSTHILPVILPSVVSLLGCPMRPLLLFFIFVCIFMNVYTCG